MMNLFTPYTPLTEMQKILESYCQTDNGNKILIVKEVPLSRADFDLMHDHLNHFVNLTGDVSAYFDIRLTVVATWIFEEKFFQRDLSKDFTERMMLVPQHHYRYYMDLFSATLLEYNIDTFGEDYDDTAGLLSIIRRQAAA